VSGTKTGSVVLSIADQVDGEPAGTRPCCSNQGRVGVNGSAHTVSGTLHVLRERSLKNPDRSGLGLQPEM